MHIFEKPDLFCFTIASWFCLLSFALKLNTYFSKAWFLLIYSCIMIFFSFSCFTVEFIFSKSLVSFVLKSRILKSRIFLFLGESVEGVVSKVAGGGLEEVNLFFLSNQATNKDMSLKMTLPKVSSADNDSEISEEEIWSKNKYFKDETSEMNFGKTNYPKCPLLFIFDSYRNVPANTRYCYKYTQWKEIKIYVNFILKNYFFKMF